MSIVTIIVINDYRADDIDKDNSHESLSLFRNF